MSFAYYSFSPAPRPIQTLHEYGDVIYAPLNMLYKHTFAREPLAWYFDAWSDYGFELGSELDQSILDEYDKLMKEYLTEQSEVRPEPIHVADEIQWPAISN